MPPVLDIWNDNFWGLTELTDAVNTLPYVPRMLGDMGVFTVQPISTLTVSGEYKDGEVQLVTNQPRGVVGEVNTVTKRVGRAFSTLHLPIQDAVKADDVQGVRAFGNATIAETVQGRVNDKLQEMKDHIDSTIEWHRVGAIKGVLLDADGTTQILDMYSEFSIARVTYDFDFSSDSADVRQQCMELKRLTVAQLGRWPMTMVGLLCSDGFFDALIQHDSVKDTYEGWSAAASLRQNLAYEMFDFAGCRFVNYRGNVSSQAFVTADTACSFPIGTGGIFKEYYAPADYEETVNTMGLPFYAKSELMPFGKGRLIETQSNPLLLNHRPSSCFAITMTTT